MVEPRQKTMMCQVITPDRTVLREQIVSAVCPAHDGLMGILPNHAPMVTFLGEGQMTYRTEKGREFLLDVAGGYLEVRDNVLTVLADRAGEPIERGRPAQRGEEVERARRELQRSTEQPPESEPT